jgi:hypothetical protein
MSDQKKAKSTKKAKRKKEHELDFNAEWGVDLEAATCDNCDWSFLLPPGDSALDCPHCFHGKLERLDDATGDLSYSHPPELVVPFSIPQDRLKLVLDKFARGIPFPPGDLQTQALTDRLQKVFLPMWLIDTEARASWQSEVGFNYDVVSHQDRFSDRQGGWTSERVTETRARWEPRMGNLARKYENIPAPALEEHAHITAQLDEYDLASAEDYAADSIETASVRLPDRTPEDAWPDAVPVLRARAAEECRHAAGADHQRDFRWNPDFSKKNWTQVLLPALTTYYLDDDLSPQPVIIQGQTAKISGARRASMKRARSASLVMALVASVLGFPSLIVSVLPLVSVGIRSTAGCTLALAFLLGISAIVPIAVAWQFNRRRRTAL